MGALSQHSEIWTLYPLKFEGAPSLTGQYFETCSNLLTLDASADTVFQHLQDGFASVLAPVLLQELYESALFLQLFCDFSVRFLSKKRCVPKTYQQSHLPNSTVCMTIVVKVIVHS